MLENTNKAIFFNSIILYARMGITTVCALLTTRFALQALGIVDFGLYSVLGGFISLIGIFNTIMLSTSNRFIAVAIGRGDVEEANKQFNVNLIVFICIAVFMLLLAYPVGDWYIHRYVNYEGDIENAMMVYLISILGAIISAIGTPYRGLLVAKEKFIVFCSVDVISHVVRLVVALLLINHFSHKLLIYTITLSIMTAMPVLVYYVYCKKVFSKISRIKIVREKQKYKEVLDYSSWIGIGAFAQLAKNQGAALLVNAFFNTIMNTALGIANSMMSYIQLFANNVVQPMLPQITKSYASGNVKRTNELLLMSTKFAFLFMFIISIPFLTEPEVLIRLWLGEVPPYCVDFLVLLIIDNLVLSLNSGVANVVFASGKVKWYQIAVSGLNILSIVIAYVFLTNGAFATTLLYVYIVVTTIKFFVVQGVLHRTLGYDNRMLIKGSYLPSLLVVVLCLPAILIDYNVSPLLRLFLSVLYTCVVVFYVGLNSKERQYVVNIIKNMFLRIRSK